MAHLVQLKSIATQVGLDAPFTFITAWGGAPIIEGETLPVYGDYAYPTWVEKVTPSSAFLFADKHALPVETPTHRIPYIYPYLTARDAGRHPDRLPQPAHRSSAQHRSHGGCQVGQRRPISWGYYMYHGGTTPPGSSGPAQERGLPQLSYDFQAPIGEYGQRRAGYHGLKLIHLFLEAYGETLAPMNTVLPADGGSLAPTSQGALRWTVRALNGAGYLFVNNFQDHVEMQDIANVRFEILEGDEKLAIPAVGDLHVKKDACFILPFNQDLHGARLVYATSQPLTRLDYPDSTVYFYFAIEGIRPEYCFDTAPQDLRGDYESIESSDGHTRLIPKTGSEYAVEFNSPTGKKITILTLTRLEAERAFKGCAWGIERVIISDMDLVFTRGGIELSSIGSSQGRLTVFPPVEVPLRPHAGQVSLSPIPRGTRLEVCAPTRQIDLKIEPCGQGKYMLTLPPGAWVGVNDLFLTIDYEGDAGMAFINGRLVADHFYNGLPWTIGMKRFTSQGLQQHGLCIVLRPLRKGTVKKRVI